jgi:DNA polymerase-3 subunit alpha
MYSNIRLLDCINRPKDLIDKAIELGLSGIAITDHECLSGHMEVNQYAQKIKEKYPDFVIALGNEVYLVDERESGIKYYHFILAAKDAIGHKALRELSSIAWYNSFTDRGMERVPITKKELATVMEKYKGHVVATTACMGGELSTAAYNMALAENVGDMVNANVFYTQICNFIQYCQDIFGQDFYIECAPSTAEDQCTVNRKLYRIAQAYNIPMVVGTDSHYLTKEDRYVHKSYLNSKGGEREVDSFYEFAHLMTYNEVYELLEKCFGDGMIATYVLENSRKLGECFTNYSLERKQMIPKVEVKNYPRCSAWEWDMFPTLRSLLASDNIQERYWVNECILRLSELGLDGETEYAERLEIEADVIKYIGDKLDDCLFAYFNTFKHYIDLFWECGSTVGPGRGSATGFLSNYLLGITQLDPIRWNLPYWRFLNKERAELPSLLLILGSCKKRTLTVA